MPHDHQVVLNQIRARFLGRYPRHTRTQEFKPVEANEADFYPCPSGMYTAVLVEPPSPGYQLIREIRRNEEQPTIELLCYRLLTNIYGRPDPIVAFVEEHTHKAVPYDWSWTLRAGHDLVEVRRRSHSIFLALWALSGREQDAAATLRDFSEELDRALRRGRFLFDARSEITSAGSRGELNIYLEKYLAAKELMTLGNVYDQPTEWKRARVSEEVEPSITGTLYQAAIVMFYIALEAFEQLLRERLCRPGVYVSSQMPLEERLRALADHCIGFTRPPLGGSTAYLEKRVRLLRRVRNQIVHGQSTQHSQVYGFTEGAFFFVYLPEQDEPHTREPEFVPTMRLAVRRYHADYVKKIVDEIVDSITGALDTDHARVGESLRKDVMLWLKSP